MDGIYVIGGVLAGLCGLVLCRWIQKRQASRRLFDRIRAQVDRAMTLQAHAYEKTTNLGYWEEMAMMEQHQLEDDKIAELQRLLRGQRKARRTQDQRRS